MSAWSIVLIENLTGCKLVKKFAAYYGIQKFTVAFTRDRHFSLS